MRDIQFYDPRIGVLLAASRQVIGEFCRIVRVLHPRAMPLPAAIDRRHALVKRGVRSMFQDYDENRSSLALAAMQNGSEAAFGLGQADQRGDFKLSGQPRLHAQLPSDFRELE